MCVVVHSILAYSPCSFMSMHRNTILQDKAHALCAQLYRRGIRDAAVLRAIADIPREEFVHPSMRHLAYQDSALPIACQQTISQPYTVAYMTQALQMLPGQSVLEIGTGSGYQAAILAYLGYRVFSIERHAELFSQTQTLLANLGFSIHIHCGDGTLGWLDHAPYHGIIVTAAAPDVPPALTTQLALGGRLIIPIGDRTEQKLYIITRTGPDTFHAEEHHRFRFVPLIGEDGWDISHAVPIQQADSAGLKS